MKSKVWKEKCIIILIKLKFEIKFIISVQDIGKIGSTTLIVEIGNNKNFPSGDKLAP